jgi:hypothetical protein
LLIFSLGLASSFGSAGSASGGVLTTISAVLILLAGIICFSLRHTAVSASAIARQHAIAQPQFQQ